MQKKLLTTFNTRLLFKKKKNSPERAQRGNIPQHNKAHIYDKPTANSAPKAESVIAKIRNKIRMCTLITIIQHGFGSQATAFRKKKKYKESKWKKKQNCHCLQMT